MREGSAAVKNSTLLLGAHRVFPDESGFLLTHLARSPWGARTTSSQAHTMRRGVPLCFYTITRTCALHGVPPLAYLTDVLPKLASAWPQSWPQSRIDELLPGNWQPAAETTTAQ